jgi:hypothetical protein
MTTTPTTRLGFRVLGSATSRRILIDFDLALSAYAECQDKAEVNREAYLSAFTFGEDFRRHLADTGSTRGYDGPCAAPWLWIDLDGEALDAVLTSARRLAAVTLERFRTLDDDALLLFFSGSKGFHLGLPVCWNPEPTVTFHRTARRFAESLAALAGVGIDVGVYDKVRLFRAPNSRHPKTQLHKRRLSFHELLHLDATRIRQLAAVPEPFGLPAVAAADSQAAADWQAALEAVEREAVVKAERRAAVADGSPRLNRATLDFIKDGADQGNRHRLLFSAAANLAEFNCSPALAHALLTDAALDTGLSPADVRRQIDCGLHRVEPIHPAPESTPSTPIPPPPDAPPVQDQLAQLWADAAELQADRDAIQAEGCQLWDPAIGPYGPEGGRR